MPINTTTALILAATAATVYIVSSQHKPQSKSAINVLSEAPPNYSVPASTLLSNQGQVPIQVLPKVSTTHMLPFPFISTTKTFTKSGSFMNDVPRYKRRSYAALE